MAENYAGWEVAKNPSQTGNPAFSEVDDGSPRDGIDDLVDTALSDWETPMSPIADALQAEMDAAFAAGDTAEQFVAKLPKLMLKLDVVALTENLTKTAFTARLAGEAGIDPDAR